MLKKHFLTTIVLFAVAVVLLTPSFSFAAGLVPCNGPDCTFDHLIQLVVNVYNYILGLASLVALFFIILSGIKMFLPWLASDQLESAKKTLNYALVGLAIVACAFLIVNTLVFALGGGGLPEVLQRLGWDGWVQ